MSEDTTRTHFILNPQTLIVDDPEFSFINKDVVQDYPYLRVKFKIPKFSLTDPILVSNHLSHSRLFVDDRDIKCNILACDYFNLTVKPESRRYIELGKFGIPEFFTAKQSRQQKIINCLLYGHKDVLPTIVIKEFIRRGIIRFYDKNKRKVSISSHVCEFPIGQKLRHFLIDPESEYVMMKSEYDYYISQNYPNDHLYSKDEIIYLANKCGMSIPPYSVDYIGYYMSNYKHYENVTPGSNILENMTDVDIFKNLGVYFLYWSRTDLIEKATKIMYDLDYLPSPMAYVPLSDYFVNNAVNKSLPGSYDDMTEVLQKNEALCLGNFFEFLFLSRNELVDTYSKTDFIQFTLPQFTIDDVPGYRQEFDIDDAKLCDIMCLLSLYPRDDRIETLSRVIVKKLELRSNVNVVYYNLKRKFLSFKEDKRNDVIRWIKQLFTVGMYFRRWNGKGPYPLKYGDTKVLSSEYAEEMGQKHLKILYEMYNSYDDGTQEYISSIPVFNHNNYNKTINVSDLDTSIKNFMINTVYIKSEYCIRMASSYAIATSYIYQKEVLEKPIPDFDIFAMDRIS